ncbi:uracil-DNA glycosylase [Nitrospina watsonii]|uniref:Uracil-DNA glycosylase n=1 Tax=Nitrospina watsonii TaxID=1323948 RepID=A0ABM9HC25_9BACT|nr:uracil-DNA glycosylase [Nitrospina watsonii]CAI2717777.1 Putative Uracil-DNA glycosylase [Nitrospina watsonii]
MGTPDKRRRFLQLADRAATCMECPRLASEQAILSLKNGNLDAHIVFVAEAPGRFGAARTGIPFSGDQSGRNFETLLAHIGLTRDDVFITNAVLCNPLENGNNRRPSTQEIDTCASYLKATLDLIQPEIVVTLGSVGLEAINRLTGNRFKLGNILAKPQELDAFTLLALYHPSPRVVNTRRPLAQQKRDFNKILRLLADSA